MKNYIDFDHEMEVLQSRADRKVGSFLLAVGDLMAVDSIKGITIESCGDS